MTEPLDRALAAYDARLPLERASTPPASWYLDPAVAERERERVFGRAWQVVGRLDQLPLPGSFLTATVAGEPVVVVRDAEGALRAFFNVCRHHAAAVCVEEAGRAQVLRCPYHGWTYGLDGRLKGTPDFDGVADFDRERNGLAPIAVGSWEGFVFVRLAEEGPGMPEFLASLSGSAAPLELSRLRFAERRRYPLACNWKVYVDNYLDGGYHVPHLHRGLGEVLDYAQYVVETGERFVLQASPMRAAETPAGAVRRGERAYYYWLYPNFMVNVYEGVMDTNLVLPLAVDRCEVVFDFYFADLAPAGAASRRASMDVAERIQEEDVAICEAVQRGLSSRAYGTGRLSPRREAGEHLFHRLLAADLQAAGR